MTRTSHSLTVASAPAVTSELPSGENATAATGPEWPASMARFSCRSSELKSVDWAAAVRKRKAPPTRSLSFSRIRGSPGSAQAPHGVEAHRAVGAGQGQALSVGRQREGFDRIRAPAERQARLAGVRVPKAHRVVLPGGDEIGRAHV